MSAASLLTPYTLQLAEDQIVRKLYNLYFLQFISLKAHPDYCLNNYDLNFHGHELQGNTNMSAVVTQTSLSKCSFKRSQGWVLTRQHHVTMLSNDLPTVKACLSCVNQTEDCDIGLMHNCSSVSANEHFLIRVQPNQVDVESGQIYFSIQSKLFESRCMSKCLRIGSGDTQIICYLLIS